MFYKRGVVKNFAKFTGKHMCQSLFFDKVPDLRFVQNNEYFTQAVTDFLFPSAANTKKSQF